MKLPYENKLKAGDKCFDILSHDICEIKECRRDNLIYVEFPCGDTYQITTMGMCRDGHVSPRYLTLENARALGFIPKEPIKIESDGEIVENCEEPGEMLVLIKGAQLEPHVGKKCHVTVEVKE